MGRTAVCPYHAQNALSSYRNGITLAGFGRVNGLAAGQFHYQ